MNLWQRMKVRKELKRLEERAHREPSPSTYVDLGQGYINLGMTDHALHIAEEGLSLFPSSKELRKLHKVAKRRHVHVRIEDIIQRLERSPAPGLYRELAALYVEVGDHAAVQATCEECIERYPDDDGAYMMLGRTRLMRFYRDLRAADGLEALYCLQKVVALDPANAAAHKLLAEFLFRIGATASSLYHLQILCGLLPGDPDVQALYKEAVTRPARQEEEIESLLQTVEARRALPCTPASLAAAADRVATETSIGGIRSALTAVAEIDGVSKAVYMRGTKALVKGDIRDGRDPFLRIVRVVARSAQRTARRLDIGSFSKGVLDGSFGHVCLCCYGEVVAAVLARRGSDVENILTELQELVAGSLYLTGVPKA